MDKPEDEGEGDSPEKGENNPIFVLEDNVLLSFLGASKKCQAINEAGFSKCPRYTLTRREERGGEEYLMLTDTQSICLFALVMM